MPLYDYQEMLINRAYMSWSKGNKNIVLVAPCGAGKSVMIAEIVKRAADKGNVTLFLVHKKELTEQIQNTLESWHVNMNYVDIAMVRTYLNRINRGADVRKPALIITDETHHSPAKSYKDIYEHFGDVPRLGFTATPIRLNGGGLGNEYDDLVQGVTVRWLIDNKRLADFKYFAPLSIDMDSLKTDSFGEYTKASIGKALKKYGKDIHGNAIDSYRKFADGQKAICYCYSVEFSQLMADRFVSAGIPAVHIDGKTDKKERDSIIERFRSGEIKVLCNVDIVSEGFDVPDCSVSILMRPTASLTLYTQQAMRCMRYKKGKTAIIIDHVGNYIRHGFPDDIHEWSLSPKKESKSESDIYTCETCFAVWRKSEGRRCPECGTEKTVSARNPKKEISDDIIEVNKKEHSFTVDYRKPEDCNSYQEMLQLARNKGYKPGWAYHQAKRLGLLY